MSRKVFGLHPSSSSSDAQRLIIQRAGNASLPFSTKVGGTIDPTFVRQGDAGLQRLLDARISHVRPSAWFTSMPALAACAYMYLIGDRAVLAQQREMEIHVMGGFGPAPPATPWRQHRAFTMQLLDGEFDEGEAGVVLGAS